MAASTPPRAMPAATFPVCSFKRVFDTEPEQEVLTLAELVACFRRFELKPQLFAKIERECSRIDRALEQAVAGESVGERVSAIREAGEAARLEGKDGRPAMRAKAEELKHYARKDAKKDLRLWSPVRYREGWKERGSEGVTHITCLVLDYDSGVRIADATSVWIDYFHMFHTTWSHTPEHPKLRLILPLAVPCPATEFDKLWDWAHARTGGDIDRQLSGIAATYALPVVPSMDAPRDAGSSAGPLLDPRDLGIDVGEIVSLPVRHATPSRMLGDPDKEYVVHETGEAIYVYDDLDEDEVWSLDRERASMVHEPSLLSPAPSLAATIVRHDSRFPIAAPRARARRKTLVVDFDGVLHSYVSGWRGPTSVPDAPVDGAFRFLETAVERFEVAVLSSRSREAGGIDAMKDWLREHGLPEHVLGQLRFPRTKPPAHVYLDDRGWRFEGTFPSLDAIDAFEPWHKREPHEAEPDDP
ncbi:MAG: hypothetical protein J0L92_20600 [Deltaproteobacteria bacterium]|nr:hypothetical protein [Deltaproteobacteria bacterium]